MKSRQNKYNKDMNNVIMNLDLSKHALENLLKHEGYHLPVNLQELEAKFHLLAQQDEVTKIIDEYKDNHCVQLLISYYFICKEQTNNN